MPHAGRRRDSCMTTYKYYVNDASTYMQYLPELTARQFFYFGLVWYFEIIGRRCSYQTIINVTAKLYDNL
ncbi:hypothetical protein BH160DRAFT_3247 [Burkholderia sp. H160]|nr:hypothetical protein BH160DRAFT_3247 [Burkholderia sp. H160]